MSHRRVANNDPDFINEDDFVDQQLVDEDPIDESAGAGDGGGIVAEDPPDAMPRELRVFKRAKRHHRVSFPGAMATVVGTGAHHHSGAPETNGGSVGSPDGGSASSSGGAPAVASAAAALGKNSRKSRTGLRGLPKKGGAGGKGVWGQPGSELDAVGVLDENDPNYDSDSQDTVRLQLTVPKLTMEQFEEQFTALVKEYFEHGQVKEVIQQLRDLRTNPQHRERIPYLAISASVQRNALQRELTSQLLGSLVGPAVSSEELAHGFDLLLKEVDDLTIDLPDAPDMIGKFIARAIADDLLPPKFVATYKGRVDSGHTMKALAKAENLLTMTHSMYCLDKVWGVSGHGLARPTKHLVKKMKLLLDEFLSSNDVDEAARCVKELEAPHFHHELVYQAVVMVIERSTMEVCQRVCRLIAALSESVLLTVDQLEKGLRRVYADIPDIQLDVPNAYLLLERFCQHAGHVGFLSARLQQEMPTKGRKRFVSEGDGGLVKPRLPLV
ncbi:hypothetical protein BOX15_Mlig025500g1 [Macrostomum lignano]|uniref:Uncharacterized protein n=2 Tax=Macrostomum lignano TaxID=282301 RepID=A0A267FN68_9PLAT|nr:hypothetical protein BOX15_Mlig025500g1 [Macrostomum lignano]